VVPVVPGCVGLPCSSGIFHVGPTGTTGPYHQKSAESPAVQVAPPGRKYRRHCTSASGGESGVDVCPRPSRCLVARAKPEDADRHSAGATGRGADRRTRRRTATRGRATGLRSSPAREARRAGLCAPVNQIEVQCYQPAMARAASATSCCDAEPWACATP
jgi:hypothetical protein